MTSASPMSLTTEVFSSNFWLYWRTMFAFENWHSALEMKLYLKRYIHHVGGLPDLQGTALHPVQPVREHDPAHDHAIWKGTVCSFHYNTKVDQHVSLTSDRGQKAGQDHLHCWWTMKRNRWT